MRRRKQNSEPRGTPWRLISLCLILAAAIAVLWLRPTAKELLRQAREVISSNPAQAEQLLQRSIELAGGDFPEAQLLRCRALGSLDRRQEALGCFGLLEAPESCDQQALLELGLQARAKEQETLALLALRAANRPGARQADVLRALISLEQAGDPDDALAHCRELESLAPDDPFAWQAEARLHLLRKEVQPAIRAYRCALRSKVDDETARSLQAEMVGPLIESGDLAEARVAIDEVFKSGPASLDLRTKNAYLLRLEGKTAGALAAIEQVLDEAPSSAARMLRGILYFDAGRYLEAADDLERVVAEQPLNKEAHYKLSQAYFKLNRRDEAERHLAESQRLTRRALETL